jgi:hypothetical protein
MQNMESTDASENRVHGNRRVACRPAVDRGCRVSSQLGQWIGNDYVATDAHEVSGKRVFEKEVWSDFTRNSFSQTLYVGDASDKLRRFLTIRAKRIIKRQP